MRKLLALPLAVAAVAVLLVAPANSATSVSVKDNVFSPRSVTVGKGGTVTWSWKGRAAHNVTFRGSAHSKTQSRGSYRHKFNSKGTFPYRCTIHPGMVGTIRVK
ncbi:MAG TPA: plastocyanin/azurin family copper-binding protein [Solirubrobacteraceae bacterium]|nr:plastocyanin/azurin family copper-binding protein [Solirubrobacteraceae bacterium]